MSGTQAASPASARQSKISTSIICRIFAQSASVSERFPSAPCSASIASPATRSIDTIATLPGPFDLVFIDADKAAYPDYFEAVLPKLAPRGLIAADNTLWSGRILDHADTTKDTVALRAFNAALAVDPRVVVVQTTVRDGVTLVRRAG